MQSFLLQLAKVKRYEAKLSVLAFIGVFDEVMSTVVPVCNNEHNIFYMTINTIPCIEQLPCMQQ